MNTAESNQFLLLTLLVLISGIIIMIIGHIFYIANEDKESRLAEYGPKLITALGQVLVLISMLRLI